MSSAAERLRSAGLRLCRHCRFQEIDEARLCAEAQASPSEFKAAFGDMLGYINALQQDFMDELRDRILKVTTGTASGIPRLQLASESYLAGCLQHRPLRAWLIEARNLPEVAANLRRQNQIYWIVMGAELKTLGWADPQAAARLFLAMLNEASVLEHRAGQALPAVREALWDFLRRGTERAAGAATAQV